jgi:hypothetical protein
VNRFIKQRKSENYWPSTSTLILDLPHICTNLLVYHIRSIQSLNGTKRNLRNAMHIWWISKSLKGLQNDFHLKNFHQKRKSPWIWPASIRTYISVREAWNRTVQFMVALLSLLWGWDKQPKYHLCRFSITWQIKTLFSFHYKKNM